MKRLADSQIELIDAFAAEGSLAEITPALLEKDIHVTDALRCVMQLEHPELALIFCGGTSLSKAYGLIERMSEDVDLKVVRRSSSPISRTAFKRQLSELKAMVIKSLSELGLVEDVEQRRALNGNRYVGMRWFYEPAYKAHGSLRPHLSLEFTARAPLCAVDQRQIGYLLDSLMPCKQSMCTVACVVPGETLAEKIISFLRRYAQYKSGNMRRAWDVALVRHVYDSYCIRSAKPSYLEDAKAHFSELVVEDVRQFGRQFPSFAAEPISVLVQALEQARQDQELNDQYQRFLLPLIFGSERPSYTAAFDAFEDCARAALSDWQPAQL